MDGLLNMAHQIGINHTTFIQFLIFIAAASVLTFVVFGPFVKAQLAREERTKGGEDLAADLHKKAQQIAVDYQNEARNLHQQIQDIFQVAKTGVAGESEKIVTTARGDAQKMMDSTKSQIAQTVEGLRGSLESEKKTLSMLITNKLLEK